MASGTGAEVEVVVALDAELGEGPTWDARAGQLIWVDILGRRIHRTDPATGITDSVPTPLHVGAIAPRAAGGYVAALQDGFWIFDDGPPRRIATVPEAQPGLRFNDGKCDPAGRFWAGTMAYDESAGAGCLYRLDLDGSVTRVLSEVSISNGLAWSRDGETMFFIDTPNRRVDAFAFDLATGAIGDRRTVVTFPPEFGWPDGMTIDADGGLWVAFWDGCAVRRFVDGRLDRTIELPVSRVTSCAFGGADLDELYITSARDRLSPEQPRDQPLAGALFRIRPGVRGVPAAVYAGI